MTERCGRRFDPVISQWITQTDFAITFHVVPIQFKLLLAVLFQHSGKHRYKWAPHIPKMN